MSERDRPVASLSEIASGCSGIIEETVAAEDRGDGTWRLAVAGRNRPVGKKKSG